MNSLSMIVSAATLAVAVLAPSDAFAQDRTRVHAGVEGGLGLLVAPEIGFGAVSAGATGEIRLYRPSAAGADHAHALAASRDGAQWIDAASLSPGPWKVRLSWKVGADDFYADRNLVIPGAAPR